MEENIGWVESMAMGDSTMLLTDGFRLLWVDHQGDSLAHAMIPGNYQIRVRSSSNGYLVLGNNGVLLFDEAGQQLSSWTMGQARDAIELPDGGFIVLLNDEVVRTDADGEITHSYGPITANGPKTLFWNDGQLIVVVQESAYSLTEDLELIDIVPFDHPDGYGPKSADIHGDVIFTAGSFHSGVTASAVRSTSLQHEIPAGVPDIAIGQAEATLLSHTLSDVVPGVYFLTAEVQMDVWLHNPGPVAITNATLNHLGLYGLCGNIGGTSALNGLDLLPGDSTLMTYGPFMHYKHITSSGLVDVPVCLWVASPNDRLDADRSNNEGCGVLQIGVGMKEHVDQQIARVFPNPFADHLDLELISGGSDPLNIQLIDAMGRIVFNTSTRTSAGERTRISLPALPDGPYLLLLDQADRRSVYRVVRQG